jgi:hypothetical protein
MTRYVHNGSNTEYTTGMIIFTIIILFILGWLLSGAIAAIPALMGSVEGALWVWGVVGGIWTGNVLLGVRKYLSESRRLSK